MTDEEMAEQYVKENGKVYYHSNGEPIFTREEDLKFAFLAGLRAGKDIDVSTKWLKPSEKLPEECSTVLAYDFEDSEPALFRFVASDTWEYLPRRIAWLSNDQIECWCEIPKYTEEI